MKRIFSVIFALCLLLTAWFPVKASNELNFSRLIDDAGLLSVQERRNIEKQLDEISKTFEADVTIVTVDFSDMVSIESLAEEIFDENEYGQGSARDGILLL